MFSHTRSCKWHRSINCVWCSILVLFWFRSELFLIQEHTVSSYCCFRNAFIVPGFHTKPTMSEGHYLRYVLQPSLGPGQWWPFSDEPSPLCLPPTPWGRPPWEEQHTHTLSHSGISVELNNEFPNHLLWLHFCSIIDYCQSPSENRHFLYSQQLTFRTQQPKLLETNPAFCPTGLQLEEKWGKGEILILNQSNPEKCDATLPCLLGQQNSNWHDWGRQSLALNVPQSTKYIKY